MRPIVHSIFERLRRLQTQTRGSRTWTRETGPDRLHLNNVESNGATTDALGARRDPKNPPFCKIAFFCLREIDFFVSALNPALFLASCIFPGEEQKAYADI
jgi:hypothetical protein